MQRGHGYLPQEDLGLSAVARLLCEHEENSGDH